MLGVPSWFQHSVRTLSSSVSAVPRPFELYPDPAANIQNVVAPPEGVRVDGTGPEVDIRVPAGGLAGGAAIEVPDGQCVDVPLLAVVAGLESLQAGVRVRVKVFVDRSVEL